jgi:hypothetical protein
MDEAIELAIEERSPYPEKATFLDADDPTVGAEIRRAADEGRAIVLVSADGSTRTLLPETPASRRGCRINLPLRPSSLRPSRAWV